MLYVFYGTDETKARARLNVTLAALQKKAPDAHIARITDESIESVDMETLLHAQGLFYAKRVVVFDKALTLKQARGHVTDRFKEMKESAHIFLVLEGPVDAELEKLFAKHATKAELCGSAKKEKQDERGDWSAANAFERSDAAALWRAVVRGVFSGTAPEMIHGQLFWKAKQLALSHGPKQDFGKSLVAQLAELPHEARRRGVELEYALERFALEI